MTTTNYHIIEENPSSEPAITIQQIEYAGRPFLQHEITRWGGSASRLEDEEGFIKGLARSIKYVKANCKGGGNLG
jgi:hypothetical protein